MYLIGLLEALLLGWMGLAAGSLKLDALSTAQTAAAAVGPVSVFYMAEEGGSSLFEADSCTHWAHFTQGLTGAHSQYKATSISLHADINDGIVTLTCSDPDSVGDILEAIARIEDSFPSYAIEIPCGTGTEYWIVEKCTDSTTGEVRPAICAGNDDDKCKTRSDSKADNKVCEDSHGSPSASRQVLAPCNSGSDLSGFRVLSVGFDAAQVAPEVLTVVANAFAYDASPAVLTGELELGVSVDSLSGGLGGTVFCAAHMHAGNISTLSYLSAEEVIAENNFGYIGAVLTGGSTATTTGVAVRGLLAGTQYGVHCVVKTMAADPLRGHSAVHRSLMSTTGQAVLQLQLNSLAFEQNGFYPQGASLFVLGTVTEALRVEFEVADDSGGDRRVFAPRVVDIPVGVHLAPIPIAIAPPGDTNSLNVITRVSLINPSGGGTVPDVSSIGPTGQRHVPTRAYVYAATVAPGPIHMTAVWAPDHSSVLLRLDRPTDRAGLSGTFACDALFVMTAAAGDDDDLDLAPYHWCTWLKDNVVRVAHRGRVGDMQWGARVARLGAGDTIGIREDAVLRSRCSATLTPTQCGRMPPHASGLLATVESDSCPVSARVALWSQQGGSPDRSTDSYGPGVLALKVSHTVASCIDGDTVYVDDITVDLSVNAGGGGRAWDAATSFLLAWSSRSIDRAPLNAFLADQVLASSFTIPGSLLTPGERYSITAQLCSEQGECISTSHGFVVIRGDPENSPGRIYEGMSGLTLHGERTRYVKSTDATTLQVSKVLQGCNQAALRDATLSWSVRNQATGLLETGVLLASDPPLTYTTEVDVQTSEVLYLPPRTLKPGHTYLVTVQALHRAGLSLSAAAASVEVVVMHDALESRIDGGARHVFAAIGSSTALSTAHRNSDLMLSASSDDVLQHSWVCMEADVGATFGDACAHVTLADTDKTTVTVAVANDAAAVGTTVLLAVRVTPSDVNDGRTAWAQIRVTITDEANPLDTVIQSVAVAFDFGEMSHRRVTTGHDMRLSGGVSVSSAANPVTDADSLEWSWSVENAPRAADVARSSQAATQVAGSAGVIPVLLNRGGSSGVVLDVPLFVPADSLVPGTAYSFVLTAHLSSAPEKVWLSRSFLVHTNQPPTPGALNVTSPDTNDAMGTELTTKFDMETSLWDDPDLPLSYALGMRDLMGHDVLLVTSAQSGLYTVPRGGGLLANVLLARSVSYAQRVDNVRCDVFARAFDALGAAAIMSASVDMWPHDATLLDTSDLVDLVVETQDKTPFLGENEVGFDAYVAAATVALNHVNCSMELDCTQQFHREPCSYIDGTCGACLEGFVGQAGHVNAGCVRTSTARSHPHLVVLNCGGRLDARGMPCGGEDIGTCVRTTVEDGRATTAEACSYGSSCLYKCKCRGSYVGSTCQYASTQDLKMRQTHRYKLIKELETLDGSTLGSRTVSPAHTVMERVQTLLHLARQPDELHSESRSKLLAHVSALVAEAEQLDIALQHTRLSTMGLPVVGLVEALGQVVASVTTPYPDNAMSLIFALSNPDMSLYDEALMSLQGLLVARLSTNQQAFVVAATASDRSSAHLVGAADMHFSMASQTLRADGVGVAAFDRAHGGVFVSGDGGGNRALYFGAPLRGMEEATGEMDVGRPLVKLPLGAVTSTAIPLSLTTLSIESARLLAFLPLTSAATADNYLSDLVRLDTAHVPVDALDSWCSAGEAHEAEVFIQHRLHKFEAIYNESVIVSCQDAVVRNNTVTCGDRSYSILCDGFFAGTRTLSCGRSPQPMCQTDFSRHGVTEQARCRVSSHVEGVNTTCACDVCSVPTRGVLEVAVKSFYIYNAVLVNAPSHKDNEDLSIPFYVFMGFWILVLAAFVCSELLWPRPFDQKKTDSRRGFMDNFLSAGSEAGFGNRYAGDDTAITINMKTSTGKSRAQANSGPLLLLNYLKTLFPGVFSGETERRRLVNEIYTFHLIFNIFSGDNLWVRMVNTYELILLISMTLLVTGFIVDLDFRNDPESCNLLSGDEITCLEEKSIYDLQTSRCMWDSATDTCFHMDPIPTWYITMVITGFSCALAALLRVPISILCDIFLRAPTTVGVAGDRGCSLRTVIRSSAAATAFTGRKVSVVSRKLSRRFSARVSSASRRLSTTLGLGGGLGLGKVGIWPGVLPDSEDLAPQRLKDTAAMWQRTFLRRTVVLPSATLIARKPLQEMWDERAQNKGLSGVLKPTVVPYPPQLLDYVGMSAKEWHKVQARNHKLAQQESALLKKKTELEWHHGLEFAMKQSRLPIADEILFKLLHGGLLEHVATNIDAHGKLPASFYKIWDLTPPRSPSDKTVAWANRVVALSYIKGVLKEARERRDEMRNLSYSAAGVELFRLLICDLLGRTSQEAKAFLQTSNGYFHRARLIPVELKFMALGLSIYINYFAWTRVCFYLGHKSVSWQQCWALMSVCTIFLLVVLDMTHEVMVLRFFIPQQLNMRLKMINARLRAASVNVFNNHFATKSSGLLPLQGNRRGPKGVVHLQQDRTLSVRHSFHGNHSKINVAALRREGDIQAVDDFSASDYLSVAVLVARELPQLPEAGLVCTIREALPREPFGDPFSKEATKKHSFAYWLGCCCMCPWLPVMMDKAIDFNILLFIGSMPFSVQRIIIGIPMPLFACGVGYGMLFVNSFNDGLFQEIGGAMFGVFFLVIIMLIFVALWNETDTRKDDDDDDGDKDSDSDDCSDSSGDDEEAQWGTKVPISPTAILSREIEKKKLVRRDTVEEDDTEKALANSSKVIEVRAKGKAKDKSGGGIVVKPRGTVVTRGGGVVAQQMARSGAMAVSFMDDDLDPVGKEDDDDDNDDAEEDDEVAALERTAETESSHDSASDVEVVTLPVIGEGDEDEGEENEEEGVRPSDTVAAVPHGAGGLPVELKEGSPVTVDAALSLSPLASPTPSITSSTSKPKETKAAAKAPAANDAKDNKPSPKMAARAAGLEPPSVEKAAPKAGVPKAGPLKRRRTVAMRRTRANPAAAKKKAGGEKTQGGRRTVMTKKKSKKKGKESFMATFEETDLAAIIAKANAARAAQGLSALGEDETSDSDEDDGGGENGDKDEGKGDDQADGEGDRHATSEGDGHVTSKGEGEGEETDDAGANEENGVRFSPILDTFAEEEEEEEEEEGGVTALFMLGEDAAPVDEASKKMKKKKLKKKSSSRGTVVLRKGTGFKGRQSVMRKPKGKGPVNTAAVDVSAHNSDGEDD